MFLPSVPGTNGHVQMQCSELPEVCFWPYLGISPDFLFGAVANKDELITFPNRAKNILWEVCRSCFQTSPVNSILLHMASVIFVLIYFLVLVLVFQLFFIFTFVLAFIIFPFSFV